MITIIIPIFGSYVMVNSAIHIVGTDFNVLSNENNFGQPSNLEEAVCLSGLHPMIARNI